MHTVAERYSATPMESDQILSMRTLFDNGTSTVPSLVSGILTGNLLASVDGVMVLDPMTVVIFLAAEFLFSHAFLF